MASVATRCLTWLPIHGVKNSAQVAPLQLDLMAATVWKRKCDPNAPPHPPPHQTVSQFNLYYYYCIDRCIYLNLSKSAQSAAGLKALKPVANQRYLMCKSLPYCIFFILSTIFKHTIPNIYRTLEKQTAIIEIFILHFILFCQLYSSIQYQLSTEH